MRLFVPGALSALQGSLGRLAGNCQIASGLAREIHAPNRAKCLCFPQFFGLLKRASAPDSARCGRSPYHQKECHGATPSVSLYTASQGGGAVDSPARPIAAWGDFVVITWGRECVS